MKCRPYGDTGFLSNIDGLDFIRGLRDDIADVIFIDPPFNLDKDYGIVSLLEKSDAGTYEAYLKHLLVECVRVLRSGGALFLYHIPYWASRLSASLHEHLHFCHWIAISMKNGYASKGHLYPAHYALLYFTKGPPGHFNRPRIAPTTCRHCGGLIKDYGGYRHIIEQQGLNLSDVWEDLSPVRHGHLKHRTANELPLKLTDRVLDIAGFPKGLMVDPFAGSGTSLVSAKSRGMYFVGNDLSTQSTDLCRIRLNAVRTSPRVSHSC